MKRRLLIIAIFLLLGAVVNVAVAWGCARWSNAGLGGRGFYGPPRTIRLSLHSVFGIGMRRKIGRHLTTMPADPAGARVSKY